MRRLIWLLGLLIGCTFSLQSQNTVGLISYKQYKSYDGLNLIYPHNQPNVYLLNNCGEIVHTWEGEPDDRPGNTAYLLEDGRLIKTKRNANVTSDRIWAGGGGATVEIRDWDNNLEWSYTMNDSLRRLHHDIAVIEKNNRLTILMLAWEIKNLDEIIEAGRDTTGMAAQELWPDFLIEIDPATDEVVWEWHAWDHLIQDFDPSKNNFGVIGDNPGRFDVNLDRNGLGNADWMHSNSIDWDPANDNVLLSVPYFNEVYIIDHTTTTEQAATNVGGLSKIGGDIMFRWGNPINYDQGDSTHQTLFFQHDAAFIDDFVDGFDPNFGKVSVFNNQAGSNFSTANIFAPSFEMYDWAYLKENNRFLPNDHEITLTHPEDPTRLYSTGLSSVQYLNNGNYLITSGRFGYTFELTPDNEIVWEYITPTRGPNRVEQGDTTLMINNNLTFRVFRYPMNYSAFDGRDLSPKGYLELNPNITYCDELTSVEDLVTKIGLQIYPNPASEMITIKWDNGKYIDVNIFNAMGQNVESHSRINGGRKYFDTSQWNSGIYYLQINNENAGKFIIQN